MFTPCTGTGFASIIEDRAKNSMQGLARQSAEHTTDGASQDLPSHGIFILSSTEAQPAARFPDAMHGLESGLSPLYERTAPDDSPFLSPSSSSALRFNDDDGMYLNPLFFLHTRIREGSSIIKLRWRMRLLELASAARSLT